MLKLLEHDREAYKEFVEQFWSTYEETCREMGAPESLIAVMKTNKFIAA
jgi:hypothetical protein